MWTKLIKGSFIIGLLLVGIRSFAAVEMGLAELRIEVLAKNLDVRIQYEKYLQAQQSVAVARGEFLPGLTIQLINVNTTLAILQSVVPTPGEWFAYQASQELAVAERFTTESIKLNILEGLTVNFMTLKYYERLLTSLGHEEALLNQVYQTLQAEQSLGVNNAAGLYSAQRQLLQKQQDIYALESLMLAEKQALLVALNRDPSEELTLKSLSDEASVSQLPETRSDAVELAVRNSPELISNNYQFQAAQLMVASQRWSFISFNGIGFDYASRLSIEKSKSRLISLQGEQIKVKLQNQVASIYKQLQILLQRLDIQDKIVMATRAKEVRLKELFSHGLVELSSYAEAQVNSMGEERALLKLELEREIKLIQLKRLLGLDSSLNAGEAPTAADFTITSKPWRTRLGQRMVSLELSGSEDKLAQIFSVTFVVDGVTTGTRVQRGSKGFTYQFRSQSRSLLVKAIIRPLVGQSFEQTLSVQ